ncbi:phosphatidate cytidylyltransferase [Chitinophaga costaii]|nr:phosphatidate cytidylyltransferase [Chitinophaga costaii]
MLAGILWNEGSFILLFTLISLGALVEYFKLVRLMENGYDKGSKWQYIGALCANVAIIILFVGGQVLTLFPIHALGILLTILFLLVLPLGDMIITQRLDVKNLRLTLLGLLYVSLPFALLVWMRTHLGVENARPGTASAHAPGWLIPLLLILFIWINDTMAYIVGSLIGHTPFSKISPKKTIEGTVGGMVLAVAVAGVYGYYWGQQWLALQHWLVLAGIAAIAGTYGDLLESKLKRMAGVKDSGRIMPGHGGFLDRFDSLLLAAPFAWIYVYFFIHNFVR